jgi:hypothetical protein
MSEEKFTKGPWAVTKNYVGFEIVFSIDGSPSPCRGEEYLCLSSVSRSFEGECILKGDTAKANAHLIAAAPAMYEFIKTYMGGHPEAEELLAKARGEHE